MHSWNFWQVHKLKRRKISLKSNQQGSYIGCNSLSFDSILITAVKCMLASTIIILIFHGREPLQRNLTSESHSWAHDNCVRRLQQTHVLSEFKRYNCTLYDKYKLNPEPRFTANKSLHSLGWVKWKFRIWKKEAKNKN